MLAAFALVFGAPIDGRLQIMLDKVQMEQPLSHSISHSAHAIKYSALKDAAVSRQNAVVSRSRLETPELSLLSSLL